LFTNGSGEGIILLTSAGTRYSKKLKLKLYFIKLNLIKIKI